MDVAVAGASSEAAPADGGLTIITRAIGEASSSQEVYALLTTYLNSTSVGGRFTRQSPDTTAMKVTGMDDVKACTVRLFSALQRVSESLDDDSRVAVKEALYVFGAALNRLGWYQNGRPPSPRSAPDSDSICGCERSDVSFR
jgi:hypothetical protein